MGIKRTPVYHISENTFSCGSLSADDTLNHPLMLKRSDGSEIQLADSADYDDLYAVFWKNRLFLVCTLCISNAQSILLFSIDEVNTVTKTEITEFGKYFTPSLAVMEDGLVIAYGKARGEIECVKLSADCAEKQILFATKGDETAYHPVVCTGAGAILVYESFFDGFYHIVARKWEADKISHPVCISQQGVNSTTPFVTAYKDDFIICFETSEPLYEDKFKWDDSAGEVITTPSFGHGWRVNGTLQIRKLNVSRGDPLLFEGNTDFLNFGESSGQLRCDIVEEKLYFSYVKYGNNLKWRVNCNGTDTDVFYGGRICPPIAKESLTDIPPVSPQYKKVQVLPIKPNTARSHFTTNIAGEEQTLFFGDLHCHSNISVCSLHEVFHCTEVYGKHSFTKNVGKMDFMALTDHQTMSDFEWAQTKKYADLSNIDGYFTSFTAFEWSSSQQKKYHNYGHYNVIYKESGDVYDITEEGCNTVEQLWSRLKKGQALTIPHHPGDFEHPLDWSCFNEGFVPAVEIYQVRGSYEDDVCEKHPTAFGRKITPNNSVKTGLGKGYKFGFTSGGEHEGVGLTGVYAKDLSRDSLFEALQKRRVYGTTSAHMVLDFRINDCFMGGELKADRGKVYIFTKGTAPIESVTLVWGSGENQLEIQPSQTEITLSFDMELTEPYYYIRVGQQDGNLAWSSPIFINLS